MMTSLSDERAAVKFNFRFSKCATHNSFNVESKLQIWESER